MDFAFSTTGAQDLRYFSGAYLQGTTLQNVNLNGTEARKVMGVMDKTLERLNQELAQLGTFAS